MPTNNYKTISSHSSVTLVNQEALDSHYHPTVSNLEDEYNEYNKINYEPFTYTTSIESEEKIQKRKKAEEILRQKRELRVKLGLITQQECDEADAKIKLRESQLQSRLPSHSQLLNNNSINNNNDDYEISVNLYNYNNNLDLNFSKSRMFNQQKNNINYNNEQEDQTRAKTPNLTDQDSQSINTITNSIHHKTSDYDIPIITEVKVDDVQDHDFDYSDESINPWCGSTEPVASSSRSNYKHNRYSEPIMNMTGRKYQSEVNLSFSSYNRNLSADLDHDIWNKRGIEFEEKRASFRVSNKPSITEEQLLNELKYIDDEKVKKTIKKDNVDDNDDDNKNININENKNINDIDNSKINKNKQELFGIKTNINHKGRFNLKKRVSSFFRNKRFMVV